MHVSVIVNYMHGSHYCLFCEAMCATDNNSQFIIYIHVHYSSTDSYARMINIDYIIRVYGII